MAKKQSFFDFFDFFTNCSYDSNESESEGKRLKPTPLPHMRLWFPYQPYWNWVRSRRSSIFALKIVIFIKQRPRASSNGTTLPPISICRDCFSQKRDKEPFFRASRISSLRVQAEKNPVAQWSFCFRSNLTSCFWPAYISFQKMCSSFTMTTFITSDHILCERSTFYRLSTRQLA